VNFVNEFLVN